MALLLTGLGFAARVLAALGTSLSPDEALHFEFASLPDFGEVYRASLTNAHPPLFFWLLHAWEGIARSEWSLRLLPVSLGTAFLWAAYRWASALLGRAAGLFALALLALLPSVVLLSAELRAYSLLLLCLAGALLALERALETQSPGRLWLSGGWMCLALLTHYSALWIAIAASVYGAARLASSTPPPRLVSAWVGCQVAVAALFAFLFATHLSRLRSGPLERQALTETLRAGYFEGGTESPLGFLLRATASIFRFLFGSPAAGAVAAALVLAGLFLLAARRSAAGFLLTLPFVFGAAGGLLGVYPYAGTRHSIYLALVSAAAIAVAFGRLSAGRMWPPLLVAAVLLPTCFAAAHQQVEERPRRLMVSAIGELRAVAPRGSVLFMDAGTASVIGYYAGRDQGGRPSVDRQPGTPEGFSRRRAGDFELIASPVWSFDAATFGGELRRGVDTGALPAGRPFWLVATDWGFRAADAAMRACPGARVLVSRRMERVQLLEVEIPPEQACSRSVGRV